MEDYEKTVAALQLMNELEKGRVSGEKEGWISIDYMRDYFRGKQLDDRV